MNKIAHIGKSYAAEASLRRDSCRRRLSRITGKSRKMARTIHFRNIFTVLLAAAGIGGVAKADVAIWTNTGGKWGNPSNWTDSVGTMLTVAPTNAASHFEVKMVSPGTTGQRYPIDTGKAGGSSSSSYLLPEEGHPLRA